MGCNSSTVVPLVDSDIEDDSRIRVRVNPSTPVGTTPTERKNSFVRRIDHGALESAEPPEETLTGDFNLEQKAAEIPPPLAFEIPVREYDVSTVARRHPPRRFRGFEEEDSTRETTVESRTEEKARRMQTVQEGNLRRSRRLVHSDAFNEDSSVMSPTKDRPIGY